MQYGTTDAMSTTWDIAKVTSTPPHIIFYTVYAYALQQGKLSSKESFAHALHSILHAVWGAVINNVQPFLETLKWVTDHWHNTAHSGRQMTEQVTKSSFHLQVETTLLRVKKQYYYLLQSHKQCYQIITFDKKYWGVISGMEMWCYRDHMNGQIWQKGLE